MTVTLTDVGLNKITNAIQGEKINITTYQLSASDQMDKSQTELEEVFHESTINGLSIDGKTVIADIIVEKVTGELNTIGLLDDAGDLIAIAEHKTMITNGMTLDISVHLTLESADNVTFVSTERDVYASVGSVTALSSDVTELSHSLTRHEATRATTEEAGHVTLTDTLDTDEAVAVTPKALKELDFTYTLPTATEDTLGGVMLGDGIRSDDGRISVELTGVEQTENEGTGTALGVKNLAEKTGSVSLGTSNKAYEKHGIAIGRSNLAYAEDSVAIGASSKAIGEQSYAIGYIASADGDQSVAIGRSAKAISKESFSFGRSTEAKGEESVAIGTYAKTLADKSISIGNETSVVATGGVAIGTGAKVSVGGVGATSISDNTNAVGRRSLATGYFTEAKGEKSIAGGQRSTANGLHSIAIGMATVAESEYSTAIGLDCTVEGVHSSSIGKDNFVKADHSHAHGLGLVSRIKYTHVIGRYNDVQTGDFNREPEAGDDVWIVGNGKSENERNTVARIQHDGKMYIDGRYRTGGADYAEMFEWADGNPHGEDRIGRAVALIDGKIKLADAGDEVIGIISGNPSIVGNDSDKWRGKYVTDDFGRVQYKDGKPVISESFNAELTYTQRSKRKEWAVVGLLGQLPVIDDGTCEVGGKASVTADGTMTKGDDYTVLARVSDTVIRALYK